jgi:hypothetical protein
MSQPGYSVDLIEHPGQAILEHFGPPTTDALRSMNQAYARRYHPTQRHVQRVVDSPNYNPNARYECVWGAGYGSDAGGTHDLPEPQTVGMDFFQPGNGYSDKAISRVQAMQVGVTIDLSDLSGAHTVRRIA